MPATKVGAGSFVKVAQRLEAKMMLPFYLVLVTVRFPPPAAGQSRSFTVESCNRSRRFVRLQRDVRTGSPASPQSKRRLHFRNTTVRLSKGPQMHGSDRRPRACVLDPRPVCLHLRSERQQDQHLSLRLDANRDAVEMKRRGSFYRDFKGSREDQNLLAWFASSPRYSATDGRQK